MEIELNGGVSRAEAFSPLLGCRDILFPLVS